MNEENANSVKAVALGNKSIPREHYIRVLRLGDAANTHPHDRHALAMAAHVLGRTPDDVARDQALMIQVMHLEAHAKEIPSLEVFNRSAINQAEHAEAACRAIKEKADADLQAVRDSAMIADQKLRAAREAALQLEQLKNANPELLGT